MKRATENATGGAGSPYQAKPWKYSSHEIARQHADTLANDSRILDIGAAEGLLGKALPPGRYHVCGIEPNADWAEAAFGSYDQIFVGTLEEATDQHIRGFDLVVCCDVLEHMTDPDLQLRRVVTAQGPHAQFIVSVPNIAHLWVRLNLLIGRFNYSDRGILDRTHLRFFTRRGLVSMLENAGLEIRWIRPTPVPLELVHPFFLRSWIGRALYGIQQAAVTALPRLLGFQFVCLAQRVGD